MVTLSGLISFARFDPNLSLEDQTHVQSNIPPMHCYQEFSFSMSMITEFILEGGIIIVHPTLRLNSWSLILFTAMYSFHILYSAIDAEKEQNKDMLNENDDSKQRITLFRFINAALN